MKVPLKIRRGIDSRGFQWTKALPFFLNSRGVLIHRVESVTTYHIHRHPHTAVHYLCNGQTVSPGDFLSEPPANRLVCQACELAAKQKKKLSADAIVGRHVHTGRIRVERACGCEHDN